MHVRFHMDGKPEKFKSDVLTIGYESGVLKILDLKSLKYVG